MSFLPYMLFASYMTEGILAFCVAASEDYLATAECAVLQYRKGVFFNLVSLFMFENIRHPKTIRGYLSKEFSKLLRGFGRIII